MRAYFLQQSLGIRGYIMSILDRWKSKRVVVRTTPQSAGDGMTSPAKRSYTVRKLAGGFLEIEVLRGPYKGRKAVVADFPAEGAYYETLKGKTAEEVRRLAEAV